MITHAALLLLDIQAQVKILVEVGKEVEEDNSSRNGDLTARTNLSQDNLLWQVGVSLNMLLTRLQTAGREASRAEYENQQLKREVARLSEVVREARAGRQFAS